MKILLLFFVFALPLAYAVDVEINSNVTGSVISVLDENNKITELGKTPLKLSKVNLPVGSTLLAAASGFAPLQIVLYQAPKDIIKLNVVLQPLEDFLAPEDMLHWQKKADASVDKIMLVQKLLDESRLIDAGVQLEELKKSNPHSISVEILAANYLIHSGKINDGLIAYKRIKDTLPQDKNNMRETIDKVVEALERSKR